MDKNEIIIKEEKISKDEYIDFLKRTDLGYQYPKERFNERIGRLVKNVQISITARNSDGLLIGVIFAITDFSYWMFITDLGVDREYTKKGIGKELIKRAHELAGGEKDIAIYIVANQNAIGFYQKLGMTFADDVMQYNHIEWTEFEVK